MKSIQEFQAEADERNLRQLQLEGATRKNAMEAMAYGQAQQKQNALQRIAAGWTPQTTADERIASLRGNPYTFAEADALEKSTLDRRKTESEINAKAVETATKRLDTAGQAFGFVRDNPSLQSAQQAISYLVQNGVWDQKTAQGVAAQVQANRLPKPSACLPLRHTKARCRQKISCRSWTGLTWAGVWRSPPQTRLPELCRSWARRPSRRAPITRRPMPPHGVVRT